MIVRAFVIVLLTVIIKSSRSLLTLRLLLVADLFFVLLELEDLLLVVMCIRCRTDLADQGGRVDILVHVIDLRLERLLDDISLDPPLLLVPPLPEQDRFKDVGLRRLLAIRPSQLALHSVNVLECKHLLIPEIVDNRALHPIVQQVLHEADSVGVVRDAVRLALLRDYLPRILRPKRPLDQVYKGYSLGQNDGHLFNLDLDNERGPVEKKVAALSKAEAILDHRDEKLGERLCL